MPRRSVMRVQPIKPALLKVDAVRLELLNELRSEGRLERKELKKTTATWGGEKPAFEFKISLTARDAKLTVGPRPGGLGYRKWNWLNKGTRKNYPITARRAPRLFFRWPGFRPKTTPHFLGSGPGLRATGPVRRPLSVTHPGIKARNWTGALWKLRKVPYRRRMDKAVRRGLKKARKAQR